MNAMMRRAVIGTAAVSMAAFRGRLRQGRRRQVRQQQRDDKTIGLLLPENETARYEKFDRPLIEAKIKELCSDCTVEYANAAQDAGQAGAAGQQHDHQGCQGH